MSYDVHDTIVAVASPPGGGARGIVRMAGPATAACAEACWRENAGQALADILAPRRLSGVVHLAGADRTAPLLVPSDLYFWPDARSYARQPSAEFHLLGSPPLLAALVDELCRNGARPAAPGEFTLRAFLGGRIDLPQAEAVMGVVDARSQGDLEAALDQLAGGLSRPLRELREELLNVLAELEAGLDFADEPLEFIDRDDLRQRLERGRRLVAATLDQLSTRRLAGAAPRVVLSGPPNAGKSNLFNVLTARYGAGTGARSIVSPTPGATRDYVVARLTLDGVACELVDVAGAGDEPPTEGIDSAAQAAAAQQQLTADLQVRCMAATDGGPNADADGNADVIHVWTKADLAPRPTADGVIACSSVTEAGIDAVAMAVRARLAALAGDGGVAPATAARAGDSLRQAERALSAAGQLVGRGGDELLAAELRDGLSALGEVIGAVCADDVLDRVFSQFCIGK